MWGHVRTACCTGCCTGNFAHPQATWEVCRSAPAPYCAAPPSTTPADRIAEIQEFPQYADDRLHGRVGDVRASGLRAAVLALTGGLTESQIARAFHLACVGEALTSALPRLVSCIEKECR
ncbi:hypothetical protein [Streptomyces sp. CB00455]|uniref:hypothetical protein n=1 Tax=Streptomyces sp. CB00455 TaxID=1703927 RepID=UPI000A8CE044|nr:hypothetical protein [Streptomyces sp. CB00455]